MKRSRTSIVIGVAVVGLCATPLSQAFAQARPARADAASRDWHAGVIMRSDFGTHPMRLVGGVRFGRVDTYVALDPMVLSDGQHDLDVVAEYAVPGSGWALSGGWRASTIGLQGGVQWQQKLLVGVAASMPSLLWGHVRVRFGAEVSMLVVKHGGGLPTDFVAIGSGKRGYLEDRVYHSLFLRVEYASGF